MNQEPPEPEGPDWFGRPKLAVAILLPGALLLVVALLFVARSEWAHSEERCPFQIEERRSAPDGGVVFEEVRSCEDGVEERRWRVVNSEGEERVFGVRRLPGQMFGPDAYRWESGWEDGGLTITVENEGAETRTFREPPPM